MITITSEYNYYNLKMDETCNFVEKYSIEQKRRYGAVCHRRVRVECVAEFLNKLKNEKKI